jgi:Na+/melibiose symporter-like transporter
MQINQVFSYTATFCLLLGLVYFVQALLKREGAWRRFAITAVIFVVTSSLAYLLTTPAQRAAIQERRAAAEQRK